MFNYQFFTKLIFIKFYKKLKPKLPPTTLELSEDT